ncbi:glycosyl hydrolase [Spirosoma aerolatum]|uniref:glycosyl hydrolase n=1 Tax=Spirosoma aerolatum TaxID=1211326 RepID=UPI0009AEC1D3|nr:glycosyl hydrolase [Spirosoma aerolatum]
MKFIFTLPVIGLFAAMGLLHTPTPQADTITYASLKEGFKNPPIHARPKVYWWWLNGYVDTVRLKEELQAIKKAGMGGVDIFEIGLPPASDANQVIPAGPAFMGEASVKTIAMAIREAGKLGLEVGLNLASSWNAGGTWVKPQHAAKTIYFSKMALNDATQQPVKLPFPTITPDRQGNKRPIVYGPDGKPDYYEEIAIIALPAGQTALFDTTNIVNVSSFFDPKTEQLTWKAPAGNWDIYRYICSNSGEQLIRPTPHSVGPIIDHFDSTATRMHVMYFIDRLKPLLGDFSKSPLKNLYLASYEAKEFTWTPTLPAAFRKLHGYDLYKFLPAIFNKDGYRPELAKSFQFDFDNTLSELMINNHYRKAKEICNRHGLQIISESGGPGHLHHIPVETLKALGALDVPRGEYWYNREFFMESDKDSLVDMIYLVKEIAAASHIYKRGIVEEESFTSYWDWQEGPADLKPLADRAFCEGMNRLVIHGFTHNPSGMGYPGIAYFAGTHYNDRNGWWPKVKPFNDYLARVSYILQKTNFVADVLHYYGDAIPNLIPPKNTRFAVGTGYDYEVINTEVLLRDLTVENGKWVLPGVGQYRVLHIGNEGKTPPAVRAKLKQLAAKGAKLVEATDSPFEALQSLAIVPDFSYAGQKADQRHTPIDHIHYQHNGLDFYLIRNTTNSWVSKDCFFRQSAQTPELWNPVTGEVSAISAYQQETNRIKIPVSLPPYGAYFVVFTPTPTDAKPVATELQHPASTTSIMALDGPWQLSFPKGWGAPSSTTFPKLISWTQSEQKGIRYFSGIATYQQTFQYKSVASKKQRLYLDLGRVSKLGEVWLNNKPLGIVWTPPYRVDITDAIKPGSNVLKVEVANTWSNRLTGDAITGETFTKTNITKANKNLVPWGKLPLIESGLLGPVRILMARIQ